MPRNRQGRRILWDPSLTAKKPLISLVILDNKNQRLFYFLRRVSLKKPIY